MPEEPSRTGVLALLRSREREWRNKISPVDLIIEAELPSTEVAETARWLGELFRQQLSRKRDSEVLRTLEALPACVAGTMTGVAIEAYGAAGHGEYWSAFWAATEISPRQKDQTLWGEAFVKSLSLLRKRNKTLRGEYHSRFLGPILAHAGLPTHCLKDLFVLLLERDSREADLDAESFRAWALTGEHRLNTLDVPARDFIRHGSDYVLATLDRCLVLLDRLRADQRTTAADAELPDRFLVPACEAIEHVRGTAANAAAPGLRPRRPELRLSPYDLGVHLALPVSPDELAAVPQWHLVVDGTDIVIESEEHWDLLEEHPEVTHVLPGPVETVTVSPVDSPDAADTLHLIEPGNPLLVFDAATGVHVPTERLLPAAPVWVLYPEHRVLETAPETQPLAEADPPFGWEGWRLVQIDLSQAQRLGLAGSPPLSTSRRPRPRWEYGTPLPGVTGPAGEPVYTAPPEVLLPPAAWTIEVSNDAGHLLTFTDEGGGAVNPLADLPRPILGTFHVTVHTTRSRGVTASFTVAEGADVVYSPEVRLIRSNGLAAGLAEISSAKGIRSEPKQLTFSPRETTRSLRLHSGTGSCLKVTVTPPHLRLRTTDGVSRWSSRPLILAAESLADLGDLVVDLPGADRLPPLRACLDGETVQEVHPRHRRGDSPARYPLAQLVDTARTHPSLHLVLTHGNVPVPVAVIRPRALADGADHAEGRVHLRGLADVKEVEAAYYLDYAPWRGPWSTAVGADGVVDLPPGLHNTGPARLLLHAREPWEDEPAWPRWPDPESPNCLPFQAPGLPAATDPGERRLIEFLCGALGPADLDPTVTDTTRLWLLLAHALDFPRPGLRGSLADECVHVLRSRPGTALLGLGDTDLDLANSARLLVFSGLASAPQGDEIEIHDALFLWKNNPVVAALATSSMLPWLSGTDRAAAQRLLDRVVDVCGDVVVPLLLGRGRPDAAPPPGGTTAPSRRLLAPENQRRVARGLHRVFTDESHTALRGHARPLAAALNRGFRFLPLVYRERVLHLTGTRSASSHTSDLEALSALSITLALLARLAARRDAEFDFLPAGYLAGAADVVAKAQKWWRSLVGVAPELVAVDLVLAELTLAGAERTEIFE